MERRTQLRYPLSCDVHIESPVLMEQDALTPETVQGTVVNVGEGGVCVLIERFVAALSVLRCRFYFSSVPVPVPVLMEVRWIEPHPSRVGSFRIGLSFLT